MTGWTHLLLAWTARDRFDIGVWECPPGMDADPALGVWIARRLGVLAA